MVSLDTWMWYTTVSRSLACLCRFTRWGKRMLFLICHIAPVLFVAIWDQPAAIIASWALFMVLLMLVPPGFNVVNLLD